MSENPYRSTCARSQLGSLPQKHIPFRVPVIYANIPAISLKWDKIKNSTREEPGPLFHGRSLWCRGTVSLWGEICEYSHNAAKMWLFKKIEKRGTRSSPSRQASLMPSYSFFWGENIFRWKRLKFHSNFIPISLVDTELRNVFNTFVRTRQRNVTSQSTCYGTKTGLTIRRQGITRARDGWLHVDRRSRVPKSAVSNWNETGKGFPK